MEDDDHCKWDSVKESDEAKKDAKIGFRQSLGLIKTEGCLGWKWKTIEAVTLRA